MHSIATASSSKVHPALAMPGSAALRGGTVGKRKPQGGTASPDNLPQVAGQHQVPEGEAPARRPLSPDLRTTRMSTAQVHNPEPIPSAGAQAQIAAGEDRLLTS